MGDNIDKPSRQRAELTCITSMAMLYRIGLDMSQMSDKAPEYVSPDPSKFIPSSDEIVSLENELSTLVARYSA